MRAAWKDYADRRAAERAEYDRAKEVAQGLHETDVLAVVRMAAPTRAEAMEAVAAPMRRIPNATRFSVEASEVAR